MKHDMGVRHLPVLPEGDPAHDQTVYLGKQSHCRLAMMPRQQGTAVSSVHVHRHAAMHRADAADKLCTYAVHTIVCR